LGEVLLADVENVQSFFQIVDAELIETGRAAGRIKKLIEFGSLCSTGDFRVADDVNRDLRLQQRLECGLKRRRTASAVDPV
jgi:hypothetical protein